MLDLVVRGTRVVTPQGVGAFDVGIKGEKIVAVAAAGTFGEETTQRLIDAGEKIVMPGGIDPHVHCGMLMQFAGRSILTDPAAVVSRAALFGGTTTIIDFAYWTHGHTIQSTLQKTHQEWVGQCHGDYSYHIRLEGRMPPEVFGQIREAIRAGYPTL